MARNYELSASSDRIAKQDGLAKPKWFRPKVDPNIIKELMQKSDAIALKDTVLWLGLMCLSAWLAMW